MPDQVSVDNRIYTLVKDFQSSYQVLVSGLVLDELTGAAPVGVLSVSLQTKNKVMKALVFIKVLDGGLFCLAGEPGRIFHDLSRIDQTLDLLVQVPGYRDYQHTVPVPRNSTFPLPTIPTIELQRLPVRIQGRVVGMTATPGPIVGAQVDFVDEPNPPAQLTEHVVALRTPLYFDHAAGTMVNQRPLAPTGTAKKLVASASLDSQTLALNENDLTGWAASDVLLVGSDATGEYVVIDSLPQDAPGQVNLRNKLNHSFPVGTAVQQYVPGASGTSTTLARPTKAGDGVLFLPINLPVGSVNSIEIADATAALVEYHALGAVTDANGNYRLDGITRVQTVYMDASAAGFAAMQEPTAWTIDYGQPVNIVDFRLLPAHP